MVTEANRDELLELIGHDGSELVDEFAKEPQGRRGFHPNELTYASWRMGWKVTRLENKPSGVFSNGVFSYGDFGPRIDEIIKHHSGVLTGVGRSGGHALAFNNGRYFDPDKGTVCNDFEFFTPYEIYIYER